MTKLEELKAARDAAYAAAAYAAYAYAVAYEVELKKQREKQND